jgi:hypothetical protein
MGAIILILLFMYGIEYGTWVDEAGRLDTAPPSFLLPFAIGGLGGVIMIGGLVIGLSGLNSDSHG